MFYKITSKLSKTDNFTLHNFPNYEFHIAKEVREKYEFEEELFSITGNVVFANFPAVRKFVKKLNEKRDDDNKVKIGEVNAAGLLDEIYHYLLREYEIKENPKVFNKAIAYLKKSIGEAKLDWILTEFVDLFPPKVVYKNEVSISDYLEGSTKNRANKEIILEELLLVHIANFNPANKGIKELFDEKYFSNKESYKALVKSLDTFFQNEKTFGPEEQDIFTFLKSPILNSPDDIEGQIDFIKERWGVILSKEFFNRILKSKDLIKEDILLGGFGGGGAPTVVPDFKGVAIGADALTIGKSGYHYGLDAYKDYDEPENFTEDIHWMPRVVLLAKNIYVWLDQLSKKYQREISRLDQIPDEELDLLQKWNFNALWLIGVWERSDASKRIKHKMGNPDAVASAYSLFDYDIAWDLGGDEAYQNLNERAKARGIRLSSDMVPNHTGIHSRWVIEHPEYFIQSDQPPFPGYSFSGEDLSEDPNIQVRIEDGYYNHSDAAVVFQRVDNRTGQVSYIYHGNDGTQMPWNDTAQLNMLKHEVREAVIDKIFHVARKFSIIRFDAAMTLAKKHFQRLWYPQPGTGGDIPSRSDHAMTRAEFDEWFPKEFWREVVDRINEEMPETLLLAEAFWLMEGYFVRSLGMHRVYNSAFMHMLMKEENEKYKKLITNTLEFEPEILKRYVNFMSNPDEETAIKQFGTDDKYFGVCTLMITLPGLPMFGHGQIEGYTEKYGMEFKRAYFNETPNRWLIDRHEREIFPLMKKRYLFSQVKDFWYYNFTDGYGNVNSNVFAYSNYFNGERALVFYNNKYDTVSGKIFSSTQKLVGSKGDEKIIKTKTLAHALNINTNDRIYYIFREQNSGLEFIKQGKEFATDGFEIHLKGFEHHVFLDFREVFDNTGEYSQLSHELGMRGVPSIEMALKEKSLSKIHEAYNNLFEDDDLQIFVERYVKTEENEEVPESKFLFNRYSYLLSTISQHYKLKNNVAKLVEDFKESLNSVKRLNEKLQNELSYENNLKMILLHKSVKTSEESNFKENSLIYLMFESISRMRKLFDGSEEVDQENYLDELMLSNPTYKVLTKLGRGEDDIFRELRLLKTLLRQKHYLFHVEDFFLEKSEEKITIKDYLGEKKRNYIIDMFNEGYVRELLNVNTYNEITYFSKENFEELLDWIMTLSILRVIQEKDNLEISSSEKDEIILILFKLNRFIKNIAADCGYRLEDFRKRIETAK